MEQAGKTSRNITRRLLAVTVAGIVLTSATVALVAAAPLYYKLKNELALTLTFSAQREADAVASVIDGQKRIASQIASRTFARQQLDLYNSEKITLDRLADVIRPILNDALTQSEAVTSITRFDNNANPLLTVGEEHAAWALDEQAFRATTLTFHGIRDVNGEDRTLVSAPIYDRSGDRVGTDLVTFSTEQLRSIAARPDGHSKASVNIGSLRATSPLFAHRDAPTEDDVTNLLRRAASGESGIGSITTRHGAAVAAFHPVRGADWGVVILRGTDEFFASLRKDTLTVALTAVGLCLVASVVVLSIVRPLAGSMIVHAAELEATIEERTASLRENQAHTEHINALLINASSDLRVFTSTISHDFRAPIVTIACNAGILNGFASAADNEEALNACETIVRACESVDASLKSLNTLTQTATADRATERVDLGELFEQAKAELLEDPAHANKQIRIEHPIPDVRSNADWTRRIALELLSNALIYGCTEEHNTVTVRAETHEGHARVHVADHGPGIDEQYHDKVFHPFESLHKAHSAPGIGLAICNRAITVLGGAITLAATPGGGATFTIQLPLADAPESQAAA